MLRLLLATLLVFSFFTTRAQTGRHAAVLQSDGSLWTWGRPSDGQLGRGTDVTQFTPKQVGTATNWRFVSTGIYHTVAIRQDGTLWAWGDNEYGQLGLGDNVDRNVPTQVGTDTDWTEVGCGELHTVAIKNDGTLWAWGSNAAGQVGDGTTDDRNAPVQIAVTDTDFGAVFSNLRVGGYHTFVADAGFYYRWGDNTFGQLGGGPSVPAVVTEPTFIFLSNTVDISAGDIHTLQLKTDGTVYATGRNFAGELGDGTTTDRDNFVQAGTATDWTAIKAGSTISYGKRNGQWEVWGSNLYGQYGNGTSGQFAGSTTPVPAFGGKAYSSLYIGDNFTLGILPNGTLEGVGDYSEGQLGSGNVNYGSGSVDTAIQEVTNATNWYPFDAALNVSLPLELVDFSGRYSEPVVELEWELAVPTGGDRIDILRSDDARTWRLAGRSHSGAAGYHTYRDSDLPDATTVLYYRLRIQELDGSHTYSDAISIALPPAREGSLTFYPNPAPSGTSIALASPVAGTATLYDATGRVCARLPVSLGEQSVLLPEAVPGIYRLQVQSVSGSIYVMPLVIVR